MVMMVTMIIVIDGDDGNDDGSNDGGDDGNNNYNNVLVQVVVFGPTQTSSHLFLVSVLLLSWSNFR